MDDIEEVIDAAQHYVFEESGSKPLLHPLSSLSASKANLKRGIKVRIQLLCAAYISLATFIPDDEYEKLLQGKDGKKIFKKASKEMDKLRKEIELFRPLT